MRRTKIAMIVGASLMSSASMAMAQDEGRFLVNMNVQGEAEVPQWSVINHMYTAWVNNSSPYGCSVWSPDVSTIDWGESFQQSRQCSQDQIRTATPVRFNPVLQTTKPGEPFEENRTVNVAQYQPAVGKRDYIDGESAKAWSAWTDVGGHHSCTTWTPDTDTVNLYDDFDQTRDCQQDQTRSRDVYHVWASGKETPKRVDTEDQTITEQEQRTTQGTKDYIYGERIGGWTSWSNTGSPYACTSWTPTPDTVNLDQGFTQTRDCQQDQDSERNIYDVWRSGKETLNRVEPRDQTITVDQSRGATGTKDYITGTSAGSWSSWSNSGGQYSCSSWSPSTSTVDWGETFTQSQSCSQNQTRSRTIYNVWKSGKKTTKTTQSDSRTVSTSNSRRAEGRDDYIVGTSYGSYSSWSTTRSRYSCSSYGPSTSTVDYGDRFTQSRVCQRDQERTRTVYKDWASGNRTTSGTQTDERTINITDTRSATGTKNIITGSQTSKGSWSKSGGLHSCSSWSPSRSTVNLYKSFTQTRSCSQKYTRSVTVKNVWADGSTTVKSTSTESKNESVNDSRGTTGTKDYKTGSLHYGSWSSYTNFGDPYHYYNCDSWSPGTSTVQSGQTFTQTRRCDRLQSRSRKIYEVWKSGKKTWLRTQGGSRVIDVTQSRSATGTGSTLPPIDNCYPYDKWGRPILCEIPR